MVHKTKLKQIIDERKITPYRLAKDCNISTSLIYGVVKGTQQVFPRWRKSISEYLELPEEEIFED